MSVVNKVFEEISMLALEDWSLSLVEPAEFSQEVFLPGQEVYRGTTQFSGVMNGRIVVLSGRTFLENICRNLLGLDSNEEVSLENCFDSMCELLNVFCGNFLTAAYGDDVVFELVFPTVEVASPEVVEKVFAARLIHCYLADDEPVVFAIESVR